MDYNIQFQVAALVFILTTLVIYLCKPKAKNRQNRLFLYQLICEIILVSLDIVSCIFLTRQEEFPELNDVFARFYIIVMATWLSLVMNYLIETVTHDRLSPRFQKFFTVSKIAIYSAAVCVGIIAMCFKEEYFHEGRIIYAYGIPSTTTYIYSACCAVLLYIILLPNWKYLNMRKRIPVLVFTFSQGLPALFQALFPEALLLSLGGAVTQFVMYMSLENPDLEYANRIEKLTREKKELFHNIVPEKIAEKLNYKLKPFYEEEEDVCIGYIKINNFNEIVAEKGLKVAVSILNKIFQTVDIILDNYGVEKIKISGDTYEVATGLSIKDESTCQNMLSFLVEVRSIIAGIGLGNGIQINASFGADIGSVALVMLGNRRLSFDVLSSTAELAFLITVECENGQIMVSDAVKKHTEEMFDYERVMPKAINDFGIAHLFYLKKN